jgi:hypothetical protein
MQWMGAHMEFYGAMHEQEVHAVGIFAMKRAVLSPLGKQAHWMGSYCGLGM